MRICIHRGTHQIGGSCVEIIASGKRILIDLGLPLDAGINDSHHLPDIPGLDGSDDSLIGILISHSHLDHFGLLTHISSKIPVYMGSDGRRIIEKASVFQKGNWPSISDENSFSSDKSFNIGPFKITPYLVDHSAYNAHSFLVESNGKRVFYSGDFRMHGQKAASMEKFLADPPADIDVLLMEGTLLGTDNKEKLTLTEKEIENKLAATFASTKGMVLLHTSSQNIDRIVAIYRACIKTRRTLIIDLYTAVILEATGNEKIPQSKSNNMALYIPQTQRVQIKNNKLFDDLEKHSTHRIFNENLSGIADKSVLLFRPLHMHDLDKAACLTDAVYIYSMWSGFWEDKSNSKVRKWIAKNNIPKINIHTSGHAKPSDLKRFADAINPARLVPIHTASPEKFTEIFNNVELHNDGEYWEV